MEVGIGSHDLFVEFDGWPLQGSVLADLCAEHVAHTLVCVLFEERKQVFCRVFLPAVDRYFAVSYVGSQDKAPGSKFVYPTKEKLWVSYGDASYCHHGSSCVECFLYIFLCLDSASEIYS